LKVLIADDHALVRAGLIDALTGLTPDLDPIEAADASEVMQRLVDIPGLDLILLDLFMPGANGFQLLSKVCGAAAAVPVVVLSASESADHVRKALDSGAAGFVPKSADRELMLSALRLVLAGGIYVPAEVMQTADWSSVPAASAPPSSERAALTARQQDVLRLLGRGLSNKQIARALALSENTVKAHVASVLRQLGASNRTEAVVRAQEQGFDFLAE
jgi:DNA-binding NarL/FixJ family response regulator